MAITNLDSLLRRQEMNDRLRASANRLNPIFGQQQQPQLYTSIPTGGFMGQNQIGGQSSINVFRTPRPELTPEELEAQGLEERAAQYQQDVGEFNLGQKEAELGRRKAEAEEIASGKFMLDGQAVSRSDMDQYQKNAERTAAKSRADNPIDPLYIRAKQFVNQNFAQVRPRMPGESQEQYQRRVDYHYNNTRVKGENIINRVYNQMKENALIRSIEQFRDDPTAYLMGGNAAGQRTNTLPPDELMNYLQRANQMFQLSGKEGNFMDDLLGRNPQGTVQRRVVKPLSSLLVGGRTADEQADIDYSNFLRRNSITSSKGTRKLTSQDVGNYLRRVSPYVAQRASREDRAKIKRGDLTQKEYLEGEVARLAALGADSSYNPYYKINRSGQITPSRFSRNRST